MRRRGFGGGGNYNRGGRGGGNYNARANSNRGGRGGSYTGSYHGGPGGGDAGRHGSTTPKLSIPERKKLQQETAINNFSSSKLTYGGSDQLVFIVNGELITTVWKKKLSKTPWNQNDVKIFISSALVTTDSQNVGELVTVLGNPESGLKRLKEIINFRMSCDAGLNDTVLSFQYVILPLLGLLTRTAITKCMLENCVDAIFMLIYENLDSFLHKKVMKMLETLVLRKSIEDRNVAVDGLFRDEPYSYIPPSLGMFFLIIVRLLSELLRRIKVASTNETMRKIVRDLQELKAKYQRSFEFFPIPKDLLINNSEIRKYFFTILENEMNIMIEMFNIEHDISEPYNVLDEFSNDNERRHDNDFETISKISIIPTKNEILNGPTYLPTLYDTNHSLPSEMARLLDRQFRLLREDMLNPIRGGISNFLTLLSNYSSSSFNNDNRLPNELKEVLNKGGKYTYNKGANDNGDLQVYANIEFVNVDCDRRNGLFCTLKFIPTHNSSNAKKRKEYWKNSKRLKPGNLVALLLPNSNFEQTQSNISDSDSDLYSTYFGVIMSKDERDERNKMSEDGFHIRTHINFDDPSIYHIALNEISKLRYSTKENNSKNSRKLKSYMVESTNIYYEAYCHVLKTLQATKPSSFPFKKYLAPELDYNLAGTPIDVKVQPPKYTRAPGFLFDLSVLCDDNHKQQSLTLNVANTHTYDDVAKKINDCSKLDKSQAQALISALTREIALIEGPPGTGKTVVGVEIMKVLLAEKKRSNIGPILTICFTNHALDQFLEHLLDKDITKNIIRLGSRTKSEKVMKYTLGKIWPKNSNIPAIAQKLEDIEHEVYDIKTYYKSRITWNDISEYLRVKYRNFFNKFSNVTRIDLPSWVLEDNNVEEIEENPETGDDFQDNSDETDDEDFQDDDDDNDFQDINEETEEEFKPIPKRKKTSIFEKWLIGEDIRSIDARKSNNEETDSDDDEFVDEKLQFVKNYEIPNTDRSLNELLSNCSIWKMSRKERQKLYEYWRAKLDEDKLSSLQNKHEKLRHYLNDIYDEERRQILLNSDVIGMTTSGAAKFQNLIKYIDPKIIICEEAGEVLEAHILTALTPSTQHLILIGDHNQLRPSIATYSLSMESQMGEYYQLDKSLFERLVDGKNNAITIEKTRLLIQRRMREEISDLIRYTIYEDLEDGENTIDYPNICGAQHNVYFIDHEYPEDNFGDSATQTHVNMYEVKMVTEMVKYFVKNGYSDPEDIAVLTPYSGQLIKIKDDLSKSFAVEIDERDAENIADMEEEENNNIPKSLNQRVKLRTVDNFQGEEAKIVIISLVRNSSGNKYSSIGFLKSKNRSNVLLSRAREGMYLIGNAKLMASKSEEMWAPVVEILRTRDQVGPGMPIVCKQHPDNKKIITEPEQFDKFCSLNGGCRSICNTQLSCGHTCVDECHFNDLDHKKYKCREPCEKFTCGHQCPRYCYEDCEKCNALIENFTLRCGHLQNVECWRVQNNDLPRCHVKIDIISPDCGHQLQNVECWRVQNNDLPRCHFKIDIRLPNCGHKLIDVECWRVQDDDLPRCHVKIDIISPDCGHQLQNVECWRVQNNDLPRCHFPMDFISPDCGHTLNVECWRFRNNDIPKCNFPVNIALPCGHILNNEECWKNQNKEKIECDVPIALKLPGCGHIFQNAKCCWNRDKESVKCKTSISVPLPCGHTLQDVECWRNKIRQLPKCDAFTDIELPCGHTLHNVECQKNEIKEEIKCIALTDIKLPCGHILKNAECWQNKTKEKITCNAIINNRTLPDCGHPLQNVECWRVQSKEKFTCNFLVDNKFPDCDHSFKIKCCKKDQIENMPKCNHFVDIKLSCGHISRNVECWKVKDEVKIKCNASIDIRLPCGHTLKNVKCNQIDETPKCNVIIEDFTFPCGHTLKKVECWKKGSLKCMEQETKKLPCCEHTIVVRCSESVNNVLCKKKCGKQLNCGHECLNKCFGCQKRSSPQNFRHKDRRTEIIKATSIIRTKHQKCRVMCKTLLNCGHTCKQDCHRGECQPCDDKCAVSCEHTKKVCNKDCSEPCVVCSKQCSWECKHQGKCELSCGIPCDRLPCNERCDKKVKCGHMCAGICGEICPPFCAKCAPKEFKNQVSDRINKTTFSNVDWNKERMIVLSCGHVYTMKSMDMLMGMEDYYECSIDGRWTSVKFFPTTTSVKTCPTCQTPVKDIRRYGRIIKKCTLDTQNRKFMTRYDGELRKISKRITVSFDEMKKTRYKLKNELPNNPKLKSREVVLKEHDVTYKGLPEITPYYYFESIALYHGFDDNSQQVWLSYVSKLLKCYEDLINIIRSTMKSPHKRAFEASLNVNGRSKDNLAFLSRLDNKIQLIYLDAILEIIRIQEILYNEILFIIQEISKKGSIIVATQDTISIKEVWQNFAERLKKSNQNHQCHGIDNIKRTMESSNYKNAEEEFRDGISNRLDKLWDNSDSD
ncbi:hypothetical protein RclHR1_00400004 [Rhizophagus clarus]|uniref:P-loop containing nucleoside triphosphate hydrolase protein n=1 Tax=Rhizophagus clarus TaxID=94130 RepID=A0A2Z6RV57_9GLOM|nr:hypothetical protein RclHR1_00400004 [Rhizophagus clarus]GES84022.1 P-loop containing nucleoside triphosphate hydrolase protein [Rhizophagus clarus]